MKAFISIIFSALIQTTLLSQSLKIDAKTQAYLNDFRKANSKSIVQGAPELLVSYYHDNIRLVVEFQRTMFGNSNVIQYFKALTGRFAFSKFEMAESETLDLGKMVVEFGSLSIAMRSKSTNKLHDLAGKYISIWERDAAGKLSVITFGWNFNAYVEFGDQMRFPELPTVDIAVHSHLPINNNISFELAALNRWMESVISLHDAALWSRFYADDAISFTQRHEARIGRKSVDEYLNQHVTEMPAFENLAIRNDRIDVLGTYVIEYASHIAVWRRGESSGVGLGKDIRIWRRDPDGALKIFRHIGMYD